MIKNICYQFLLMLIAGLAVSGCAAGRKYQMTATADQIIHQFDQLKNARQSTLLKGTLYETPVFIFDSGKEGAHIIIIGGTHGDEPAGYEAALRLLTQLDRNPPQTGKIILIPMANRVAIRNFERRVPVPQGMDKELGNLNRCYPGDPNGTPMQQLAYQIAEITRKNDVDVFIDLHEARYSHLKAPEQNKGKKGLGQTLIYTPNEASALLLMYLLDQINEGINNPDERFSGLEKPILHSGAWWAGHELDIASFTFETSRQMKLEKRIGYHLALVRIALEQKGIW